MIAFLDWVSKIDNQGWPPRPILVTAAARSPGAQRSGAPPPRAGRRSDPVGARPRALFNATPPGCCGLPLGRARRQHRRARPWPASRRRRRRDHRSAGLQGQAKDAAGYIRESIVESERPRGPGPDVLGRRARRSCRTTTARR